MYHRDISHAIQALIPRKYIFYWDLSILRPDIENSVFILSFISHK